MGRLLESQSSGSAVQHSNDHRLIQKAWAGQA